MHGGTSPPESDSASGAPSLCRCAVRDNPVYHVGDNQGRDLKECKHAAAIGLTRGYSAHSMRGTFITTAPENDATLDDVQRAAGHSEPSTTKLYHRRGYNPGEVGQLFSTY